MSKSRNRTGTIVAIAILTMVLLFITAMPVATYTYDREAAEKRSNQIKYYNNKLL